jgi:hypothetical protein
LKTGENIEQINKLRKSYIKSTAEFSEKMTTGDIIVALASASAQCLGSQVYNRGARFQDELYNTFIEIFDFQYKRTIKNMKEDFKDVKD